jgi:hypothetical protein
MASDALQNSKRFDRSVISDSVWGEESDNRVTRRLSRLLSEMKKEYNL